MCWKHSWKPFCERFFSSSIAFLIMWVVSQQHHHFMLFSFKGTGKNQLDPGQESGGCSRAVTLFFAKKSLTKTDWCARALSWKRNQPFFRAFPSDCIPKATDDVSVLPHPLTLAIPLNYSSEFQEHFEAPMYIFISANSTLLANPDDQFQSALFWIVLTFTMHLVIL
jgi:hypothetical protein